MTGEGTPLHGAPVSIKIGSLVQLLTADHPRDPALRRQGYESGIPVIIGENVWIGSDAIVGAGVAIGDDAIVCAGTIVTRDVPDGAPSGAIQSRSPRGKDDLDVEEAGYRHVLAANEAMFTAFALVTRYCSQKHDLGDVDTSQRSVGFSITRDSQVRLFISLVLQ